MADDFEEFHDELRSVAGDLLAKESTAGWPVLVDAGWTGLEVTDDLGGAGATFREVAIIAEEIGSAAAATGYLGAALAVGALNALRPDDSRDRWLGGIASGETRPSLVGLDAAGGDHLPFTLDGRTLTGRAGFIPDADGADLLLVLARDAEGEPVIVAADGLTVEPQPVLDETRRLATVSADGVEVSEVLRFDGDAEARVSALLARAAAAIACDSLGIGEAMLAATVSYAGVRHQFGRAIGSFQAVKHACADMMVTNTVARQLVRSAVGAVADDDNARVAAAMAKSYACAAAVEIAGKAMQLHGGIGYTWESGVHVYLKRAALNRSLFGSPSAHRARLADRYLSPTQGD